MQAHTSGKLVGHIRYYDRGVTVALEVTDWQIVTDGGADPSLRLELGFGRVSGELMPDIPAVDDTRRSRYLALDTLLLDLAIQEDGGVRLVTDLATGVLSPQVAEIVGASVVQHVCRYAPDLCGALAELAWWRTRVSAPPG